MKQVTANNIKSILDLLLESSDKTTEIEVLKYLDLLGYDITDKSYISELILTNKEYKSIHNGTFISIFKV